jgi:hypothetical protein
LPAEAGVWPEAISPLSTPTNPVLTYEQYCKKSTQQNSTLVDVTTAATRTLRQEANTLQDKIANFRVAWQRSAGNAIY